MALNKLGVKTKLITGRSNLPPLSGLKVKKIISAKEMLDEVKRSIPVDIAICAAAVSDFKPLIKKKNKIKKSSLNSEYVKFEKNHDILDFISKNNNARPKMVVGFSAETENVILNSKKKIKEKYCDLIVANDVSKKDKGFNSEYNQVSIIDKKGVVKSIPKSKKSYIANILVKIILDRLLISEKNIN